MINTAYSIDSNNPIESFLTARKNYIPGVTKIIHEDTDKNLKSASKYYENGFFNGDAYQTFELYDTVQENNLYESFEYPRYWHGYLTILRPLLCLANYETIMFLSMLIFLSLLICVTILTYKKIGAFPAMALILACVSVDLLVVVKSINEILCFDLALIYSIFILIKKQKDNNISLAFFVFGSITNFLDLFTNPIVTYGIPIMIYFLVLLKDEKINLKKVLYIFFKTSISWVLGYALTWMSKWVITDVILNRNVIKNGIEQVLFRSIVNSSDKNVNIKNFLERIILFFSLDYIIILIGVITLIIIFNIKKIKDVSKKSINKKVSIITYFIGILIPVVWYIVLSQHSIIHLFFTYRNLIIFVFCIELITMELLNATYKK
mgnify:CR=1 FL=1